MKYFLDTNIVSLVMTGDARVLARLDAIRPSDVSIPLPAAAEVEYGIERLPRSRRRELYREAWSLVRRRIVTSSWSESVTTAYATIKAALERRGARIEDVDIAIAAHALADEATLVTANVRHMGRIAGLRVEDWTREGGG